MAAAPAPTSTSESGSASTSASASASTPAPARTPAHSTARTAAPASRWLRELGSVTDPRIRLVCFPHAGGAASFFRAWPDRLDRDTQVVAVRYPGREDRITDPLITSMDRLAEPLTEALAPLMDRPVAFFGHSMGASVAYEVACRLAASGRPAPVRLLVSGRAAPHRLSRTPLVGEGDDALIADVRRRGGPLTAALDDPDLLDLVLPAIRSDYRLVDDYAARARLRVLDTDVTAYYGDADPDVPAASMLAWGDVSPGRFDARCFAGDHFYLVPRAAELAGDIAERLRTARSTGTPAGPAPRRP